MPPRKNKKEEEESLNREIIVRNFEFFDSDEDIQDDNIEEYEDYDGYDTADEETEDKLDILNELLKEIAEVEVIGKKVYKINFYDTRIYKLEEMDSECDFDFEDSTNLPIIPDGGEEFIGPYLMEVAKKIKYFEDCIFETNINQKIIL